MEELDLYSFVHIKPRVAAAFISTAQSEAVSEQTQMDFLDSLKVMESVLPQIKSVGQV